MHYYEYVGNPHVHTTYSDGALLHAEVAQAAGEAGLTFVIVTDHNVWVHGCEGYYGKVLLLVGEEVHDVRRSPQANHLLVYNAETEMAPLGSKTQPLINAVTEKGGFTYLAHPVEYASPLSRDLAAVPWTDWEVTGYAGIELWNTMSEFKALMNNRLSAMIYNKRPTLGISGPFRATLHIWDQLLLQGRRVGVIGGADADSGAFPMEPQRPDALSYTFLLRGVNTHIITPSPLNGVVEHDKVLIYEAMRTGHTWVGYDMLAPTAGFRFTARSGANQATMGEELMRTGAITLEVQTPQRADIRLVRNGAVVARGSGQALKFTTADPGVYRAEAYRSFDWGQRGWIFSSPIYIM